MYAINDIIRINVFLKNYFDEDIYNLFLEGYCYEYYNILKEIYPEGRLVLHKTLDHCAILIGDNVYDVSGIRNKDDFVIAKKMDEDFIYSFYNRLEENTLKEIHKIINGYVKENKKIKKN